MAATFPPFPRLVFTILEPISLVGGWYISTFATQKFIHDQYPILPSTPTLTPSLLSTPNAQMLAFQLGNLYLLCALLGVFILNSTTDIKVAKAYILALAIADVGHVAPTLWVMGRERSLDLAGWNAVAWGNVGVTAALFVVRVTWLAGGFGSVKVEKGKKKEL
ncbi:MAG: hypothetical protein MMC33_005780 [Icmadophila ericetorum]|nr:hypothetical protein [Icmadophila ericetorum]